MDRGGDLGDPQAGAGFAGRVLVPAGQGVMRAQRSPGQQGVARREVGELVPSFVVQADQRGGGAGAVIDQGGGQPADAAVRGAVMAGDGDLRGVIRTFTAPISECRSRDSARPAAPTRTALAAAGRRGWTR